MPYRAMRRFNNVHRLQFPKDFIFVTTTVEIEDASLKLQEPGGILIKEERYHGFLTGLSR